MILEFDVQLIDARAYFCLAVAANEAFTLKNLGAITVFLRARWPLRIRVSISPKGSVIDIFVPLLPARLNHAGDLTC